MAITLDDFIRSLTDCGLMDVKEVQSLLDGLPSEHRPQTAEDLARELYSLGKLTKFQAQAIYQKKTRGLVVGNYVVLDKLGKGGMGAVYKAQHKRMKRVVALKMLPSSATRSPEAVRRFQREVEAAAKLSHPNIVTAHDADEAKGVHFLVMEYVEGQDLHALVTATGTLPVARAVDYVIQAAKGLEYAHSQGVIHRDIKPRNLLLDKKGTVKVLDMGLARIQETAGEADATADDGLTQSGQVMGTFDYMPPEQALDTKTADVRADIYSLGCTLHYLLIGRSPFGGDTVGKKMLAHREHPIPSLRELRSDVPKSLDDVFQKMLAKRPEDRQPSMSAVISELQGCKLHEGLGLASAVSPSSSPYAETVSYRPESTEPPAESLSPLDELFASEPIQITERLVAPSRRFGKPWKNRQRIVFAAIAGGAAFVVLLLGIILQMRTSKETPAVAIDKPGATVQVWNDPGKVTFEARPAPVGNTPSREPDREAAEWVLQKGGKLTVRVGEQWRELKAIAELPEEGFSVTAIDLSGNTSVGDEVFERLNGLTALGALNLDKTRVTGRGLEKLQSATVLRVLRMEETRINDATLPQLKGLAALEQLFLTGTAVTDAGLQQLGDLVNMSLLVLNSTQVTGPGLKYLHGMKSLDDICLSASPLEDSGIEHLKAFKSLTNLGINDTRVTDAGIAHLQELPNLTFIAMHGTQVTDAGLACLEGLPLESLAAGWTKITGPGFAALKSLKSLEIGGKLISDATLEAIAGLTKLECLMLTDTAVTDNGLRFVAGFPNLKTLSLQGAPVTDKGLEHLKALKLTELRLGGTQVTAAGVAALKAARPECKIAWAPPLEKQ
ncbi:MAG: protein kinase [Rhodopirellula sp.]|nr:protein kinase [Rhodopirellula sp.]